MSYVSVANTNAAQNAILVPSTTYYTNFNTATPGQTGASVSAETYQATIFGSSSAGSQTTTDAQTWSSAVGGTYTYFSEWSTSTGGTFERGGSLTASISPPAGSQITIAIGGIVFTAA